MTNVENLFDFAKVKTTREGLELYVNFTRMVDAGKAAFSSWVLSVAKRFWDENPGKPSTAMRLFEAELESEIDNIKRESADKQAAKKLSLTGNGGLAQAFKRIKTAVVLGADLKDFDTVSKLQAYVTERKNADTAQKERELAVAEIEMELKEEGLEPGTPEYKKELADRSMTLIKGGKSDEEPASAEKEVTPADHWDKMCLELANELRVAAEELGAEEVERRFKGILNNLHAQLDSFRKKLMKKTG